MELHTGDGSGLRSKTRRQWLPGRRVWVCAVLFGLAGALAIVTCGPLLGAFLIFETPNLTHAEAALVLSGSVPDRALQAGEMLRRGQVDSVLIVNDPLGDDTVRLRQAGVPLYSNGELNRFILMSMEVPEDKLRLLPRQSTSTWQDALSLRSFLEEHPMQSVAVVTCKYHTYRSWLVFRQVLAGMPVELSVVGAERCAFDGRSWWRSRSSGWRVVQEWLKLGGLVLGYR